MGIFNFKKQTRDEPEQIIDNNSIDDPILKALLDRESIDRQSAMNIPALSACLNKIADTISTLDIKLYKRENGRVEEVTGDNRTYLLNNETGDTLDGVQFKKAMVMDMYLARGGYAFVNKQGKKFKSIHYVEANKVSFQSNTDPIFKDYKIGVGGIYYEGWQFIKLLRNTSNGYYGTSLLDESPELMSIIYSAQLFEKNQVKTGGNKKGFIKATNKLTKDAMTALKNAFRKLYSNSTENVVVLNDGLDFKESSNSSVELQLNENKKTNNDAICKICLVPPTIVNGGATEDDRKQFAEQCIMPILTRFEKSINSVLLLENEKDTLFFAFDTSDLLKVDIEKRYNAYKTAVETGWLQLDEIRTKEKMARFDLDFIKLGLQDVLYFPNSKEIYTPNTNKVSKMGDSPTNIANNSNNIDILGEGGAINEN